jgi:3-phosphoinositide dependent protein kinase-1
MDEDNLYFIFENCCHGDLSKLIAKTKNGLENEVAVHYAAEIVSALEFMHGKRFVHRDLKPENIMIGDDKHIRIIDLGDAKDFENEE